MYQPAETPLQLSFIGLLSHSPSSPSFGSSKVRGAWEAGCATVALSGWMMQRLPCTLELFLGRGKRDEFFQNARTREGSGHGCDLLLFSYAMLVIL
jgi:hypothetical protein